MQTPQEIIINSFIKSEHFQLKTHADVYKSKSKHGEINRFNYIELIKGSYRLTISPSHIVLMKTEKTVLLDDDTYSLVNVPRTIIETVLTQIDRHEQIEYETLFNQIMGNIENIFERPLEEIFENKLSYMV